MKHLLIIFSLLLTSVSWSEDVNFNDLVYRDGFWYEKFSNVPFTGNVVGRIVGKIKDGEIEGEWLMFYENGQLQYKINHKDGKQNGGWFLYYETGELRLKKNYKDDKKHGESLTYYENGQLEIKENYKDDKRDGELLRYDKNGYLEKTEIWKDGKLIEKIEH